MLPLAANPPKTGDAMDELTTRIDQLERQVRRNRRTVNVLAVGLVALLGVLALGAATEPRSTHELFGSRRKYRLQPPHAIEPQVLVEVLHQLGRGLVADGPEGADHGLRACGGYGVNTTV